MSHSVKVTIIANQEISICGKKINIHALKSLTLGSDGHVIGYVADDPREQFNCSEDYFKDIIGDNLPEGDTVADCAYRAFKCKVCGWSFTYTFSTFGHTSDIWDKMIDHVHLKHK